MYQFFIFPLPLFWFVFLSTSLFHLYFVSVFMLLWVSSVAYPNLLGTKMLGCCYYILLLEVNLCLIWVDKF
jgi:hypothetical protein